MTPLTSDDVAVYKSQKLCYICKRGFSYDKIKKRDLNYTKKIRDHCHFTGKFSGAAHSTCNLRYKVPQKIPVKIHNGSKYDYHFIIKELAEEFRGEEFECLGENTEKYISFSVPIKIERDNDSGGTITYKIKFIDSCRFMPSKLSNLVDDNLTEIKKFCALRAKTYTYSMDDDSENIKDKGVKRCIVKRRLMFEKYKDSLFNNKTIM